MIEKPDWSKADPRTVAQKINEIIDIVNGLDADAEALSEARDAIRELTIPRDAN